MTWHNSFATALFFWAYSTALGPPLKRFEIVHLSQIGFDLSCLAKNPRWLGSHLKMDYVFWNRVQIVFDRTEFGITGWAKKMLTRKFPLLSPYSKFSLWGDQAKFSFQTTNWFFNEMWCRKNIYWNKYRLFKNFSNLLKRLSLLMQPNKGRTEFRFLDFARVNTQWKLTKMVESPKNQLVVWKKISLGPPKEKFWVRGE
jgi:hypothetical protein